SGGTAFAPNRNRSFSTKVHHGRFEYLGQGLVPAFDQGGRGSCFQGNVARIFVLQNDLSWNAVGSVEEYEAQGQDCRGMFGWAEVAVKLDNLDLYQRIGFKRTAGFDHGTECSGLAKPIG